MKLITLFCFALFLLVFTAFPTPLKAQDDEDRDYDKRVDKIVNDVYRSIDEQFGTCIFTDESDGTLSTDEDDQSDGDVSVVIRRNDRRRHSSSSSWSYSYSTRYFPAHYTVNSANVYPWENMNDDVLFRYNRVEGLFLGLNSPKQYAWDRHRIELFGSGGYGFAPHRWRYSGGLAEQFGTGSHMFEFGAEGHSLTDTDDKWNVSQSENNISSIVARDDYRDYFGRDGFSVWTGFYRRPASFGYQLQVGYLIDRYESLERNTNWSVFGGEKLFHDNPAIDEGHMKSVLASFEIENIRERKVFTSGWSAAMSMEHSSPALRSDFDFNRYLVDLRRYQPFSTYDNLNLRVRAGAVTGTMPAQKSLAIGGIGTLPAYGFKDLAGNRLLLANAEYLVNGRMFDDEEFFPSWFGRNLNFILFMDAGYVSSTADNSLVRGFENLTANTLKSDWGFGIGTRDAKVCLGFAWRTDISEPVHVFLRLDRPF